MLNFLGIGAQKAGTTWLCEQLRKHPQIDFPAVKEVHFWDQHYKQGLDWYKGLFPGNDPRIKQGEITPAYAIISIDKIAECHTHFPDIKLFYNVRNPIERAWSSALMALRRAEMQSEEASDQWFIDHFTSNGSLMRGDYVRCLRNWLTYYDRSQLLLIQFPDISDRPLELLRRTFVHLGVDESVASAVHYPDIGNKINSGVDIPLRDSLRNRLEEIYHKKIEAFDAFIKEEGLDEN